MENCVGVAPSDLIEPARRAFLGVAKAWRLSEHEQSAILGIDSETLLTWKGGPAPRTRLETITRISYLLGIFKAINTLLPDQKRADEWIRAKNRAPIFGGQSALTRL